MASNSLKSVNPNAEIMSKAAALFMNINAAKGLQDVMKSNLGPKGTIKMLVGGAGDLKLTKDGNVLLKEMQIQNPTAVMIARTAVAQDDITGDGTSSTVLIIGELLKQAERYLNEGLHPRVLVEGFEAAKAASIKFLDTFKVDCNGVENPDKELLTCVAKTALRSKLREELADKLTTIVVDAVCCIANKEEPIDLHMVEIMHMRHKLDSDTRLVQGLVLDHGSRHPDMPKHVDDAFILTMNVSLEYEKSEVNSSFMYSDAEQRERMVAAEREYTDDVVRQVIALKKKVCDGTDKGFVVITQKGIDPISLDMLAKENILGLRRAKKRNMERLVLSCGGVCVNSPEEFAPEILGHAGKVYEHVLGEEKYTFVEDVKIPQSCTILLKGPNDHTLAQLKDAVRDGLRSVKNTLQDKAVVPGAGAFEAALNVHLLDDIRKTVEGRAKRGVEAFAEAMLIIPKTLAENSGYDAQDVCIALADEVAKGNKVGLDVTTGEPFDPTTAGVYDNFIVKQQILHSAPVIATQLLLVDEVMRAGVNMRKSDVRAAAHSVGVMAEASRPLRVGTEASVPSTSTAGVKSLGGDGRWWRDASAGAAAGMVSVLALHPLDVIKTRLQVQDGINRRAAVYRGTVHAFRTVAVQEGARGFYAGVVPAMVGSTVAWGVYFHCYNNAKTRYREAYGMEYLPSHLHLASAAEAGLVVSLATNPIWVVKTRLQLQRANVNVKGTKTGSHITPYRGFTHALSSIFKHEGIAGLYKGITPSLFLISHGALQFATYEKLKRWRSVEIFSSEDANGDANTTLSTHTTSTITPPSAFECALLGIASKLFASTVTYPSQVVRSRMQQRVLDGAGDVSGDIRNKTKTSTKAPTVQYGTFAKSLTDIIRREGVGGLYKGMVPNVLRTLPSSGVTFMVYETVREMLGSDE